MFIHYAINIASYWSGNETIGGGGGGGGRGDSFRGYGLDVIIQMPHISCHCVTKVYWSAILKLCKKPDLAVSFANVVLFLGHYSKDGFTFLWYKQDCLRCHIA